MAKYKSPGFGVKTKLGSVPNLLTHSVIELYNLPDLGFLIPKAQAIANGEDRADDITWLELMQCWS